MNYTSIEQSKHLLELGLKPETADMCYESMGKGLFIQDPIVIDENYLLINDIPCWSTGALIELMPKSIRVNCIDYPLLIFCNSTSFDVEYNANIIAEIGFNRDILIDAILEMIYWLLENNHIKKG